MKKIILDTNAYSGLLRGDESILEILSRAAIVYMSVFVLGELLTGFKGGTRESTNVQLLRDFLERPTVKILDATMETSEIFAEIKTSLKTAGNPIPINDIWIAAHAVETGSMLITFDAHFKKITGLRIASFSSPSVTL